MTKASALADMLEKYIAQCKSVGAPGVLLQYTEVSDINAALRAEPAGEPVAWHHYYESNMDGTRHRIEVSILPKPDQYSGWGWRKSTPLFAHPPSPSALAEGWVAVPREPTPEMLVAEMKAMHPAMRWPLSPGGFPPREHMEEQIKRMHAAMLSALRPVAGENK